MTGRTVRWAEGRWTNEPPNVRQAIDALEVEAARGSDFWEKTLYGFQRASGHALLAASEEQTAVEVSFELAGFDELYDQAGLMLWASPTRWIKAGVELNDRVPCLGAVVTDGYSDWSLASVPEWNGRVVTIRASRSHDAVILRATATGHAWRTIRVARFQSVTVAQAGPFVCAPTRAGFKVRFTRWVVDEADPELHWTPPDPGA